MNIKNVETFQAEPFICVKEPIVASWHTPYKKPNGERALACNVRARETLFTVVKVSRIIFQLFIWQITCLFISLLCCFESNFYVEYLIKAFSSNLPHTCIWHFEQKKAMQFVDWIITFYNVFQCNKKFSVTQNVGNFGKAGTQDPDWKIQTPGINTISQSDSRS